jgi:uncharacterized membrane protein YccF (DUF307 family)
MNDAIIAPTPAALVIPPPAYPGFLVRATWFLCVGWWLGGAVSLLAYALTLTLIGLPLGLWLINRLPYVITLRPQNSAWRLDGNTLVRGQVQRSFGRRALYFVLVGWWLCGLWLALAYALVCSVLGLPLAAWLYNRTGAITTIYRS